MTSYFAFSMTFDLLFHKKYISYAELVRLRQVSKLWYEIVTQIVKNKTILKILNTCVNSQSSTLWKTEVAVRHVILKFENTLMLLENFRPLLRSMSHRIDTMEIHLRTEMPRNQKIVKEICALGRNIWFARLSKLVLVNICDWGENCPKFTHNHCSGTVRILNGGKENLFSTLCKHFTFIKDFTRVEFSYIKNSI